MNGRFGHGVMTAVSSIVALVACGGSDGGSDSAAGGVNTAPLAQITSPAEGSTFRAGDTLSFLAQASDPEDGALPASSLTWWADLHHNDHTHPFVPPTPGNSGSAQAPLRGETSDNVFYRFHFKATDSAGLQTEVTRDVLPQKSNFTLATQPAGLQLTLDGQPFAAPRTTIGVVGLLRDVGAADQVFNGHTYQFSAWSDGGAAMHTIATPAADATFTAVFIDRGPVVNAPPTVTLTAPANNSSGNTGTPITLSATAADSDGSIAGVQFFDGATAVGAIDTTPPYSVSWTPPSAGVHTLTARATDNGGAVTTSAPVSVSITDSATDTQPPVVAITAPAALADGLTGTVSFNASATDNVAVANVEFQVDGVTLATDTSAPYGTSIDTSAYAPGQHVLRVRGRDSAGNVSAWSSTLVRVAGSGVAPAGFTRNASWTTGLSLATTFTQLPDGRLLVAQQGGALRVVQSDGTLLAAPMLTVTVDSTEERGLVGVVAHPAFASNGFIYIYYTTPDGGTHNRLSRFTVNGNTASNEVALLNLPPLTAGIHNSGAMHFGTDGKLYVAVGDNAVGTQAQDLSNPFGKILRLNDDGTIPGDNPFCTTAGNVACAVWALGLRNPFTFAIQPGTGRMHINDVGQASWEEINVGARGANYGWPTTEGPTTASGITAPLFTYPHDEPTPPGSGPAGFFSGICVIGGGFYPASGPFPAPWRGGYFFADFGQRFIGFIDLNNDNAAYAFGSLTANPVSLMVAADGALLVLTQGAITRFTHP